MERAELRKMMEELNRDEEISNLYKYLFPDEIMRKRLEGQSIPMRGM